MAQKSGGRQGWMKWFRRGNQSAAALDALAKSPMLADLPKRHLRTLAGYATEISLKPDHTIVLEGEPGSQLCIILHGECEVRRAGEPVAALHSGQVFGEMALLGDEPRDASVVTTQDTDLLVLGRSDFEHVLKIAPALRTQLERQIEHRRKDPGDFLS